MDKIYLGAAYYPELWDESEIEKDIARCKQLGLNVLRVGEFAWGKMEPREGEYELGWLVSLCDRLYEAGISVVMCTPSATPPRWMLDKYDEVRYVCYDGVRERVSSRCHTCKTSAVMREKNRNIVTAMAKALGKHPAIIGWQIDNEIFPYWEGCYCENCKQEFRNYLKGKYGSVENLNKRWGMARWSLDYPDFQSVQPPYPKEWKHPSLRTEWRRFQCRQIISYVNEQADVLHAYTKTPIGTDMMTTDVLGHYDLNEKLDMVQINHYNTAADLKDTAFWYDFLRPIKEQPFWVTETQVGWNGSEFAASGYRPQGNCYANTLLPVAMGAEMNMYWLFRQQRSGHEIAHGALYSACGREYAITQEVKRASDTLRACQEFLCNSRVKSRIALHYSNVAANNFLSAPMLENFNYTNAVMHKFYDAFTHYNVDVIDTPHTLEGYDVLLSPFLSTIDDATRKKIEAFVRGGGTWIVGPMSDIMTEDTALYTHAPFSFLEELAGVYVKYVKPIANNVFRAQWNSGEALEVSDCYYALEPTEAKSLAAYSNEEFAGYSAVTERALGKGKIILLGSVIPHEALRSLVGKEIAPASENVRVIERTGRANGLIVAEVEHREGRVVLPKKYTDIESGETLCEEITLKPYELKFLQETK